MADFVRRWRSDRGSATTQMVLVVPVLLLVALLVVQFALVWHARHLAQYAAQRALATARTYAGTAAGGRAQGERSLAALGSRILTRPSVTVDRTATLTAVRVRGRVMAVVPGLHLYASGTAAGPTERLTTPGGGHL
ncbi:TadE/TadG family type IV pilus assembly protein [Streptomyces sp. NPDC093707]|uniref:TadE/TadG family type IV pilus assembly protein n=1 Tax=Streptomyces sp. NPDC093707 TaxID=3154984 RepID=UPI00344D1688